MSNRLVLTVTGCVALLVLASTAWPEEPLRLVRPDGEVVQLHEWLAEHGTTVVIVWASWAPRGSKVLADLDVIATACRERQLALLVIDVQEELAEADAVLRARGVPWLHDRHGATLKRFRVIALPAMMILDPEGTVVGQPQVATPEAVRSWQPRKEP